MEIKPSVWLALTLFLMHSLAVFSVFGTAMPLAVRVVALFLISASFLYYLARDALLGSPGSWREISFVAGELSVLLHSGSRKTGRVAAGTVATPYFIVLGIQSEGWRLPKYRVVLRDAVGRDKFRRLSVHLRFV